MPTAIRYAPFFEGRIPCSTTDCDRLKVQLVLYERANEKTPTTYWLGIVGTSGNDRLVTQGTWEIRRGVEGYPEALVYALDQHADEDVRYFWRVNDNILLLLDRRMSPKAGNGAWGYHVEPVRRAIRTTHIQLQTIAAISSSG